MTLYLVLDKMAFAMNRTPVKKINDNEIKKISKTVDDSLNKDMDTDKRSVTRSGKEFHYFEISAKDGKGDRRTDEEKNFSETVTIKGE